MRIANIHFLFSLGMPTWMCSDDDDDGWVDDDGEASAEEDEAANAADEAKESGDDYFLPEIVRVQTIETLVRLVMFARLLMVMIMPSSIMRHKMQLSAANSLLWLLALCCRLSAPGSFSCLWLSSVQVKKCTDALDKKAMVELSSEPTAAGTVIRVSI